MHTQQLQEQVKSLVQNSHLEVRTLQLNLTDLETRATEYSIKVTTFMISKNYQVNITSRKDTHPPPHNDF
jgi:hypothetical protein